MKHNLQFALLTAAFMNLWTSVHADEPSSGQILTEDSKVAKELPKDSVASEDFPRETELAEVVVKGRTQRIIKFGVEYIPDKKTKKTSIDATALLDRMQIPQLSVSETGGSIKTFDGQNVSVFIDYVPASSQDLSGMRTEDVIRVEVLDYPDDPRFNSAPHVVNFIMQKYEWGGYTKLNATGQTLNTDIISASVYSKMVYRKWTFDANGSGSWSHLKKERLLTQNVQTFRDVSLNGRHYDEISRFSDQNSALINNNSQWASIRAAWQSEKSYVQHVVSFGRSGKPIDRSTSSVSLSDPALSGLVSRSDNSSQALYPSVSGYYQFTFPKGNSLVASWNFTYQSNKRYSSYALEGFSPILNDNREKTYVPNFNASYSKQLPHSNTFRTSLMTFNSIYHTRYAGSYDGYQKLLSSENMLFLEYMQNWQFGLSLYSRVGGSYVVGRVNGVNTLKQFNPRLGFQLQWQFDKTHSASFEGWWGNSHPSPSTANDALVQSSELLWLQGNKDLRNTLFQTLKTGYNFVPNNKLSVSLQLQYEGNPHRQGYRFYNLPGLDGLVRQSFNDGNSHLWSAYLGASYRLFENSLSFRLSANAKRYVLTGIDHRSLNALFAFLQAQYVKDSWAISLFFNTPYKSMGPWSNGYVSSNQIYYGLNLNYGYGDWNVRLSFLNWFQDDSWDKSSYRSLRFDEEGSSFNVNYTRSLSLTLTYTVPYGKKVNRNNELQQSGGAGSAILQ